MKTPSTLWVIGALLLLLTPGICSVKQTAREAEYFVYIGTFTGPPTPPEPPRPSESKGIYAYRFHPATGQLTQIGLAAETWSPSFLAVDPSQRFLYAVVNQKAGGVSSFAIDTATGKLTFINKVSSRGDNPCYLECDREGRNVLVANFTSGSVAVLPVGKNGQLAEASAFVQHVGSSVNPARQQGPHAHMISAAPDDRFALAADLGLDKLLVYRFDADRGTLIPNSPAFARIDAGAGPRHFAFHPSGKFVYVVNEMASSITAFAYSAGSGTLRKVQSVPTVPKDFAGQNTGAEIEVHPSGKFLFVSNRGLNSIGVFAIDVARGTLSPVEQASTRGRTPRAFEIDPTGSFLFAANQDSHNVVIFRFDPSTGHLSPTGQVLDVQAPACVKFARAAR